MWGSFFLLSMSHSFISLDNNEEYAKDEIISNFFSGLEIALLFFKDNYLYQV